VGPLCLLCKCCWDRTGANLFATAQQAAVAQAQNARHSRREAREHLPELLGFLRRFQHFLTSYVMFWVDARSLAPLIGTSFLIYSTLFDGTLVGRATVYCNPISDHMLILIATFVVTFLQLCLLASLVPVITFVIARPFQVPLRSAPVACGRLPIPLKRQIIPAFQKYPESCRGGNARLAE
jgi:hypothetical protein